MDDHAFQKTAVVKCPECGAQLFFPALIAGGQEEKRTCTECGLVIKIERPVLMTNQRPGPKEVK